VSKVSMTVRQIINLGLWDRVCEYKNWKPWILNEGKIGGDDIVEFDSEFKEDETGIRELKVAIEVVIKINEGENWEDRYSEVFSVLDDCGYNNGFNFVIKNKQLKEG